MRSCDGSEFTDAGYSLEITIGEYTRLGGTVVVLLGSLLIAPEYRRRAIALFVVGALSHHVLDLLLISTTGYSYAVFWPVTEVRFPRGDLYLSSDRGPVVVVGVLAVVVWCVVGWLEGVLEASA